MSESKIAVVTGGGRGIGKAAALGLADHGWTVAIAGRTQSSLDETVTELATEGLAVATDVSDEVAVDALFEHCLLYTSDAADE